MLLNMLSDCGDPVPINGQSDTPEGSTIGAVASVRCNDGFVLFGDDLLTCESGPVWSDYPTCVRGDLSYVYAYARC